MDNSEQIKCPYCGANIPQNSKQCPNCREWFCEPKLALRFVSVPLYISASILLLFMVLPFALICLMPLYRTYPNIAILIFALLFVIFNFDIFWITFNFKNIVDISSEKDKKKFTLLFLFFVLTLFIIGLFGILKGVTLVLFLIANIALSYRILRIFEKHSKRKYDVNITHHEFGMILFRILYVIYFAETFSQRVYNPDLRYCLELKNWIKYAILIILIVFFVFLTTFFLSK
ncbi:zinc ribbon domain-containing protein [bacterium]|nr:zinc ribbon domain-containing protein [bacterium]